MLDDVTLTYVADTLNLTEVQKGVCLAKNFQVASRIVHDPVYWGFEPGNADKFEVIELRALPLPTRDGQKVFEVTAIVG